MTRHKKKRDPDAENLKNLSTDANLPSTGQGSPKGRKKKGGELSVSGSVESFSDIDKQLIMKIVDMPLRTMFNDVLKVYNTQRLSVQPNEIEFCREFLYKTLAEASEYYRKMNIELQSDQLEKRFGFVDDVIKLVPSFNSQKDIDDYRALYQITYDHDDFMVLLPMGVVPKDNNFETTMRSYNLYGRRLLNIAFQTRLILEKFVPQPSYLQNRNAIVHHETINHMIELNELLLDYLNQFKGSTSVTDARIASVKRVVRNPMSHQAINELRLQQWRFFRMMENFNSHLHINVFAYHDFMRKNYSRIEDLFAEGLKQQKSVLRTVQLPKQQSQPQSST